VRLLRHRLEIPLRRRKPTLWFVNSTSDLFHERLSFEDIAAVFVTMARSPQHQFQVLTKRPARMLELFQWVRESQAGADITRDGWPLPNVWLGVSAENQAAADERIPLLLNALAAVRFVSCEPLLGAVDLSAHLPMIGRRCPHDGGTCHHSCTESCFRQDVGGELSHNWNLHWVIAGDESGPGRRGVGSPAFGLLAYQCRKAGVAYFQKQLHQGQRKLGFEEFPAELQVREMPGTWHRWAERYRPDLLEVR
jgi:protein gp37